MPDFVDRLANALPDPAILALSALVFGLLGGAIAWLANRLWFRRWPGHSPYEDRLADTAHASLLGFSAFVLALLITNGFGALSRTEAAVRQEAVEIHRMDRELEAIGPVAQDARSVLTGYARDVARDEWKRLAKAPISLSPLVQADLEDLWKAIRTVQRDTDPAVASVRDEIGRELTQIESLRAGRLSAATDDIPAVFWLILMMFVIAASFLSGREAPKRFGMQINVIHMSALGLAIGLVIILNNPFRGDTSASPQIIGEALGR